DVFVPINKHGSQSRRAALALEEAMAGERPVLVFPAGLCSRKIDGKITDLPWNKMFVQKSRQYGRTIIPLHFQAENSAKFYRTAMWRKRLHIPFNIEMALLPGEVFRSKGKTFSIICGSPVEPSTLPTDLRAATAVMRQKSDALAIDSTPKDR
ncbi:MAG: glycerol acyltransferase, partial [Muribaculaceae bacterium]